MQIILDEYAPAPPLSRPFTPTDTAVLKLCNWINQFDGGDDDLVVSLAFNSPDGEDGDFSGRTKLVLSPRRGIAVEYDIRDNDLGRFNHAMLFTPRRWAIHLLGRKTKYDASSPFGYRPTFSLSLSPHDTAPRQDHKATIRFGFGLNWLDKDDVLQHFAPKMNIEPAIFLHDVRRDADRIFIERGVLHVVSEQGTLRSDATTGRLIEWNVTDEELRFKWRVTSQRRALETTIAAFDARAHDYRNTYDPRAPAVSFLAFAAEEAIASSASGNKLSPDERRRLQAVARHLIVGMMPTLEKRFNRSDDGAIARLVIPLNAASGKIDQSWESMVGILSTKYANESFLRGSWPWTIRREFGFIILGQSRGASKELIRIAKNDEFGPVGALAMAEFFKMYDARVAAGVAMMGLTRLDKRGFRRDTRLLLSESAPLDETVIALADTLREVPHRDLHLLAKLLPTDWRPVLIGLADAFRANRDRPTRDVLNAWLDDVWKDVLRARVADALRKYRAAANPMRL
jgi:hypothetical protein